MPKENCFAKKRSEHEQHHDVPQKSRSRRHRGTVIEHIGPITKPAPKRLQDISNEEECLSRPKASHVFHVGGETRVHMKALNWQGRAAFRAFSVSLISAESLQHS